MILNPVLAKRHLTSLFDLMVEPVGSSMGKLDDGSPRIDSDPTPTNQNRMRRHLTQRACTDKHVYRVSV